MQYIFCLLLLYWNFSFHQQVLHCNVEDVLLPIQIVQQKDKEIFRLVTNLNCFYVLISIVAYASIIAAISLVIGLCFAFFGFRMYKTINVSGLKNSKSHKRVKSQTIQQFLTYVSSCLLLLELDLLDLFYIAYLF